MLLEAWSIKQLVLETGLPVDTCAQVCLVLQQVLGERAEVFKDTLDLTDQLASNVVWDFCTAALGRLSFRNSRICGCRYPSGCANSKKRCDLTRCFAIWWIDLHLINTCTEPPCIDRISIAQFTQANLGSRRMEWQLSI